MYCAQSVSRAIVLQDYSREGLTECQEKLVQHLRMFGLVYQRKVYS